jgi:hypothetical protein
MVSVYGQLVHNHFNFVTVTYKLLLVGAFIYCYARENLPKKKSLLRCNALVSYTKMMFSKLRARNDACDKGHTVRIFVHITLIHGHFAVMSFFIQRPWYTDMW